MLRAGKDVHCYYCPKCTTHVYHHQVSQVLEINPDLVVASRVLSKSYLYDLSLDYFRSRCLGILTWYV